MHFIDRRGRRITAEAWYALYRDRAYAIVRRDDHDGFAVETSWTGVAHLMERESRLYLVQSYATGKRTRDRPRVPIDEVWCATEAEALERHEAMLKEIKEVFSA